MFESIFCFLWSPKGIRSRDQNLKDGLLMTTPADVFCSVPGRLSLLSSTSKYKVSDLDSCLGLWVVSCQVLTFIAGHRGRSTEEAGPTRVSQCILAGRRVEEGQVQRRRQAFEGQARQDWSGLASRSTKGCQCHIAYVVGRR